MLERRRAERHPIARLAKLVAPAIEVSSAQRHKCDATIRDLSDTGVLFVSRNRFTIGERIVVKFPQGAGTGRVVRASLDDHDATLFHHLTAIEFDVPAAGDDVAA